MARPTIVASGCSARISGGRNCLRKPISSRMSPITAVFSSPPIARTRSRTSVTRPSRRAGQLNLDRLDRVGEVPAHCPLGLFTLACADALEDLLMRDQRNVDLLLRAPADQADLHRLRHDLA